MKKSLSILGLFILLALGFFLTQSGKQNPNTTPPSGFETSGEAIVIHMTPAGFEPSKITITPGTIVTFINEDATDRWPASNIHPTHRIYPNSDIDDCSTEKETLMFDACRGIPLGESWSFTFNESGIWRMHDHLVPQFTGTITVQ